MICRSFTVRSVRARLLLAGVLGLAAGSGSVASGAADAPATVYDPRIGIPFAVRNRPSLGSASAAVVVVEISNFKCPFCRRFHREVFPRLRRHYVDSGKVCWVMLNASDNPADGNDPIFAVGRCLFEQGRYWDLMDFLFQNGAETPARLRLLLAGNPAVATGRLDACLAGPEVLREVARDFAECEPLKINGTPTFLLRKRRPDGQFTGVRIEGNEPAEYFEQVIDRLLATP